MKDARCKSTEPENINAVNQSEEQLKTGNSEISTFPQRTSWLRDITLNLPMAKISLKGNWEFDAWMEPLASSILYQEIDSFNIRATLCQSLFGRQTLTPTTQVISLACKLHSNTCGVCYAVVPTSSVLKCFVIVSTALGQKLKGMLLNVDYIVTKSIDDYIVAGKYNWRPKDYKNRISSAITVHHDLDIKLG